MLLRPGRSPTRIALALLFALVACGRAEQGYPPQYEVNFNTSCQAAGTSRAVCACTWAKIEAAVPRAEFDAFERMPAAARAATPLQRSIEEYARNCAAETP